MPEKMTRADFERRLEEDWQGFITAMRMSKSASPETVELLEQARPLFVAHREWMWIAQQKPTEHEHMGDAAAQMLANMIGDYLVGGGCNCMIPRLLGGVNSAIGGYVEKQIASGGIEAVTLGSLTTTPSRKPH